MGVNAISAEALIKFRSEGSEFGKVLTLGRMDRNLPVRQVESLLKHFACLPPNCTSDGLNDAFAKCGRFADPLFTLLGAPSVDALDASPFEGATIIHNLDENVPDTLHERFDFIFDGGLLEHVFDFPTAIKNCMDMLRIGGTMLLVTPANNECGHGFYQFSPELFFRLFTPQNGFAVDSITAVEAAPDKRYSRWFKVADPAQIKRRVLLQNLEPVYLLVQVRKTASTKKRLEPVTQHDYGVAWNEFEEGGSAKNVEMLPKHLENTNENPLKGRIREIRNTAASVAPGLNPFRPLLLHRYRKFRSFANSSFYSRVRK